LRWLPFVALTASERPGAVDGEQDLDREGLRGAWIPLDLSLVKGKRTCVR
jgi:hypothetical protein